MSSLPTNIVSSMASRSSSYIENESAKYFVIPQRCVLSLIAAMAVLISMSSKSVIDVVALENFVYEKTNETTNDTCPIHDDPEDLPEEEEEVFVLEYGWSLKTRHLIKNSFYWGTLLTRIPGGFFTDQFGGKYIVMVCMLLSSFCIIMIPGIVDISAEPVKANVLIAGRFLQGVFGGPIFPGIMSILARWVPISERATTIAFVFGIRVLGDQIGTVLHHVFEDYSWRPACHLSGGMGIVWCIFWYFLIYPSPWNNPYIKKKELRLLEEQIDENIVNNWKPVPWNQIAVSIPIWALVILYVGEAWQWGMLMQTVRVYVPTVLRGEPVSTSIWWIPFFLYLPLAATYGLFSDWFVNGSHLSITTMRKTFAAIEMCGAALCMTFIGFERCNLDAIMVWYTVALCTNPTYLVSNVVISLDMSPNFAGILFGILSTVHKTVYTASLHIVSYLTVENSLTVWSILFYSTAFVQFVTTITFLILGNADIQPWNTIVH